MSMILDALSRAEKERQAENATALDAGRYVPSSTIKDDRFKKWVLIALVANFVLVALLVGGIVWKSYSNPESTELIGDSSVTPVPEINQSLVPDSNPPVQHEEMPNNQDDVFSEVNNLSINTNKTSPATSLIEETKVNIKKEEKVLKNSIKKIAVKNPPVKYASQPIKQPAKTISNESIIAATIQNNSENRSGYTKISDLPVSQRSQLGQFEVNVHVYDDNPQRRFVLINMVKYKEGDVLPGGNTLVSTIIPEGVVIDYGSGKALLERTQ